MPSDARSKRESEKETVEFMISLYCRRKHSAPKGSLCPVCSELRDYAFERTDLCPMMEEKTFCTNCPVHCYRPEMRERIRIVMRYSGPRMILYHPIKALRHVRSVRKERKNLSE